MTPITFSPIPENQRSIANQLLKNMRAALSYLSFYSADSPFISQAVSMFNNDLSQLLVKNNPLVFQAVEDSLFLNGIPCEDTEAIARSIRSHGCLGFSVALGVSLAECRTFLKMMASEKPLTKTVQEVLEAGEELPHFGWVTGTEAGGESPAATGMAPKKETAVEPASTVSPVWAEDDIHPSSEMQPTPDIKNMLVLVAEAWQLSRQVERHLADTPQASTFMHVFRSFFGHLLDRIGAVSGEMESIKDWFHCPEGENVEIKVEDAMRDLLAVAMEKGYTDVLYDPAAAGLVSECLAHWGASGRHDLLEQTVEALARGLQRDVDVRELSMTHLMDSRPWVSNRHLVSNILDHLTAQLSEETNPGLYQKGLLIAWDLLEPAVEVGLENQVLGLLSTLHLHAEDEAPLFPERPALVRQWIYGKSNPDLVRKLVALAHRRHRLGHYPLLSAIAAPILLEDFYAARPEEVPAYLKTFFEMKEQIQAALTERLSISTEEMEVRLFLMIVHTCGVDPGLSLQISAWVAKGSRDLKESIIHTIEEVGEPGGGPALRLALLDDDEGIASEAARVLAKIGFKPAAPLMIKAVKLRKKYGKPVELFQVEVCKALGIFALSETLPFLKEQTRKKNLFGGGASPAIREAATRALMHFKQPEVPKFLEWLYQEGDEYIRKAVQEERELLTQVVIPKE
jgi:hypothetical protein